MHIAIMGAGALGGYFGGRLAAAGHQVDLIARGAHLAAIRAHGLRIESPKGDLHVPGIRATDDPADVGPVDAVLFFVKNYDVEQAAAALAPMLGADTFVVTFQNGVSAPDRVADIIGQGRVVPGVARIPAAVRAPGIIEHRAAMDTLIFGETDGVISARCEQLAAALRDAGTDPVVSTDILAELWGKFVLQSATSAITAMTRLTFGQVRAVPETATLLRRAMQETADVGRAIHPAFAPDMAAQQYAAFEAMPGNVKASMQDDLLRGKRLELPWISGDVVRLGRAHGVATPVHEVAYGVLLPFVDGAPG